MSTEVRWRGGTADEHSTFTGAPREITVVTDDYSLRVHDGATPGGHPIVGSDAADMAAGTIRGRAAGGGDGPPQDLTPSQVRAIAGPRRVSAVYTSNALLSTEIPLSGSPNTSAHGTQVATVQLAASSDTAKICIDFAAQGLHETDNHGLCAILLVDDEAIARRMTFVTPAEAEFNCPLKLRYEYVPGDTALHTYRIRVGASLGAMRLNSALGGGTVAAVLTAEEAGEPP